MKYNNKLSKKEYEIAEARAKLDVLVYKCRELSAKLLKVSISFMDGELSKSEAENLITILSREQCELENDFAKVYAIIYPQNQAEQTENKSKG